MLEANVNTTDLEVPQSMNLDTVQNPEPIKPESDEIPIYKDEVRNAIFAKRRDLLTQEMEAQGLEPQGSTIEPEQKEVIQEIEPKEESVQNIEPEPKIEPNPEQEKFILQVYGQTKELTKDEMIREAQKGLAATQIFQEGHRMRDEALQIANSVKQHLQPQQVAKENPPQEKPSVINDEKAREIAKRINYGSEEDQINAIKDLGASIEATVRGQVPTLPPEQLVNIATQQAINIIDARTEQDTLKTEFKDLLEDRYISAAADAIANDLARKYQEAGTPKSRLELFREAGTIARERYLKPVEVQPIQSQKPAAPVIAVNNDKLERKRAAPKPPAAANKVALEPPPAYGVGVSSIVNQMRKARGQPITT